MPALLPIAKSQQEISLLPGMTNRHGLIAGATGTGKTVTLQKIAESLTSAACSRCSSRAATSSSASPRSTSRT